MLSPPALAGSRDGGRHPRTPETTPGRRLEWLDALRGIAVLAVVFEHLSYLVFREIRQLLITPWFDSGKYGVMVFFLVSGYIIPASLERHGSVGRFWIGRAFRLYPLLAVAVACLLLFIPMGLGSLEGRVSNDPITVTVAHATFLQDMLGVQNFFNVLWTLSYEMVFYLLVTVLFLMGIQTRSAEIALGLGLSAVLLAPVLPAVLLSGAAESTRWVVAVATVALTAGILCAVRVGRSARLVGATLLGALAVVLILFNQRAGMWEGLVILAVMFTGTAIYRAERGDLKRAKAVFVIASVWFLALVGGVWNFRLWAQVAGVEERQFQQSWAMAILLTGFTFGTAWLLRRRRFPRVMTWIGVVSYSIYLMHTVLLSAFHQIFDPYLNGLSLAEQVGIATLYFGLLFTVARTTHRYVEGPGQMFGRRLGRLLVQRRASVTVAPLRGEVGKPAAQPVPAAD